jgi:hypothetical protein
VQSSGGTGESAERTLEMRVAELEDKLAKIQLAEEQLTAAAGMAARPAEPAACGGVTREATSLAATFPPPCACGGCACGGCACGGCACGGCACGGCACAAREAFVPAGDFLRGRWPPPCKPEYWWSYPPLTGFERLGF